MCREAKLQDKLVADASLKVNGYCIPNMLSTAYHHMYMLDQYNIHPSFSAACYKNLIIWIINHTYA